MPALTLLRFIGPYLIVGLLAFGAAWKTQGWRYGERIADMKRATAEAEAAASAAAKEQSEETQRRVAVIDAHRTKELTDARTDNDRLRAAVADGSRRLRIAIQSQPACPSGPAANSGVDSGASAELAPSARRAYFALRSGLIEQEAKLAACQEILRSLAPPAR